MSHDKNLLDPELTRILLQIMVTHGDCQATSDTCDRLRGFHSLLEEQKNQDHLFPWDWVELLEVHFYSTPVVILQKFKLSNRNDASHLNYTLTEYLLPVFISDRRASTLPHGRVLNDTLKRPCMWYLDYFSWSLLWYDGSNFKFRITKVHFCLYFWHLPTMWSRNSFMLCKLESPQLHDANPE